jgi:hypothetical protein
MSSHPKRNANDLVRSDTPTGGPLTSWRPPTAAAATTDTAGKRNKGHAKAATVSCRPHLARFEIGTSCPRRRPRVAMFGARDALTP